MWFLPTNRVKQNVVFFLTFITYFRIINLFNTFYILASHYLDVFILCVIVFPYIFSYWFYQLFRSLHIITNHYVDLFIFVIFIMQIFLYLHFFYDICANHCSYLFIFFLSIVCIFISIITIIITRLCLYYPLCIFYHIYSSKYFQKSIKIQIFNLCQYWSNIYWPGQISGKP